MGLGNEHVSSKCSQAICQLAVGTTCRALPRTSTRPIQGNQDFVRSTAHLRAANAISALQMDA